jgi:hypothetical protein
MTAPLILPGDIIAFKNQEFSVVSIAVSLFEDCVLIIVNDGGKLLELKTDQVVLVSRRLFRGK